MRDGTCFCLCAEAECCLNAVAVPRKVHLPVEYQYQTLFFFFREKAPFPDKNIISVFYEYKDPSGQIKEFKENMFLQVNQILCHTLVPFLQTYRETPRPNIAHFFEEHNMIIRDKSKITGATGDDRDCEFGIHGTKELI